MNENRSARPFGVFLLLVPLALFGASLAWWHRHDTRPAAWDESVHLQLASDYRDWVRYGTPVTTPWASVYPPLYHLTLMPAVWDGHALQSRTIGPHLLFAAVLLAALLFFAEAASLPPAAVLCCAFVLLAGPLSLSTSRRPLIDFSLMGWTTLAMAFLFLSDRFGKRSWSIAWGVASGLGLLMKPQFGIYLLGPLALCLPSLRASREARRHAAYALLALIVVMLPWYGWQGAMFLKNAVSLSAERGSAEGDPSFRELAGWWFYLKALHNQLGWTGLFFLAGGWLGFVRPRDDHRALVRFLAVWAVVIYVAMTIINNKDSRYTMPMLPPLVLLAAIGWRRWGLRTPAQWGGLAVVAGLVWGWQATHVDRPAREDWQHHAIAEMIRQHRDPAQPWTLVSVLSNHAYLFPRGLRLSLRNEGLPIGTSSPGDATADFTEFIILKEGNVGPDAEDLMKERRRLEEAGRSFTSLFKPVAELSLPDGSVARVLHRETSHRFQVPPMTAAVLAKALEGAAAKRISGPLHVTVAGSLDALATGRPSQIVLTGGPWQIRDLPVATATVTVEGAWLNLYRVVDQGTLGLLAMRAIRPQAEIRAADVQALLNRKVKGLKDAEVRMESGRLSVSARFHGVPVSAVASLSVDASAKALIASIDRLSILHLPIPGWLFGKVHRYSVPLEPIPSFPVQLDLRSVIVENGVIALS